MEKKICKIFSKLLILFIISSNILTSFAYDYDKNGNSIDAVTYQSNSDETFSNNAQVFAELANIYNITIPKTIILNGEKKNASYFVKVDGDIAGYEFIHVVPDEDFILKSKFKKDAHAKISQSFTTWSVNDLGLKANGFINANDISAGKWKGTFYFNIFIDGQEPKVAGDIIIPDFLDDDFKLLLKKIQKTEPGFYDDEGNQLVNFPELENVYNINIESLPQDDEKSPSEIIKEDFPETKLVKLPTNITSIAPKAFENTDIEFINIPENVNSIGDDAFNNTKIKFINIPIKAKTGKNILTNTPVSNTHQIYYNNHPVKEIILDFEPEETKSIDIILQKGYRYQIIALYNFVNDVTKESTITSSNANIVKFTPDCFLDALNIGDSVISGTYCAQNGNTKDAYINVHVLGEDDELFTHKDGDIVKKNIIEPTCTTNGSYDEIKYTLKNGIYSTKTTKYTTSKLGHNESGWIMTKQPSKTSTGSRHKICSRCKKELKKETLPVELDGGLYSSSNKLLVCSLSQNNKHNWNWSFLKVHNVGVNNNAIVSLSFNHPYSAPSNSKLYIQKGITKIGECLITGDGKYAFPSFVYLPDGVVSIGKNAFKNAGTLTSIRIPDSCTSFGDSCFADSGLTNISIPDGTKIIPRCFCNHAPITTVYLPSSLVEFKSEAFLQCTKLSTIYFDGTLEQWNKIKIGKDAFKYKKPKVICIDGTKQL